MVGGSRPHAPSEEALTCALVQERLISISPGCRLGRSFVRCFQPPRSVHVRITNVVSRFADQRDGRKHCVYLNSGPSFNSPLWTSHLSWWHRCGIRLGLRGRDADHVPLLGTRPLRSTLPPLRSTRNADFPSANRNTLSAPAKKLARSHVSWPATRAALF
jgi:hypothetical protein